MKRILLTFVAFVLVYCAQAQVTGGGQQPAAPAAANSPKNMGLYIKFGLSSPGGDAKSEGFKSGYIAEFGFMPNFDTKKRKVAGGMIIADDFAWYKLDNQPATGNVSFLGIKVGPAIHVNPVDKLWFNAYYAIHGGWAFGKIGDTQLTENKLSFMNTFGFNLKYKPFVVGLEFDSGKMNIVKDAPSIEFPTTRITIGFSM